MGDNGTFSREYSFKMPRGDFPFKLGAMAGASSGRFERARSR